MQKEVFRVSYSHAQSELHPCYPGEHTHGISAFRPTLPKAPWQMSVRVAPPAMNCGLEHSSWEQNTPGIREPQGRQRARPYMQQINQTIDHSR